MIPVVTPLIAPNTKPIMKIHATGTGLIARFLYSVKCEMYSKAQKTM